MIHRCNQYYLSSEVAAEDGAAGEEGGEEGGAEGEGKEEGGDEGASPAPPKGKDAGSKKLTNQFNYSDRASQTYNNPFRVSIRACHYETYERMFSVNLQHVKMGCFPPKKKKRES